MFNYPTTKNQLLRMVPMAVGLLMASTSAQAATWFASPSGASASSCGAQSSPCSLSYALSSKVNAGDTLALATGTYSGSITLSGSRHVNLTLTAEPGIISALGTFSRGVPSGTDNRPLIAGRVQISASGATVSYLRVRNQSAPFDGGYDGVIGVNAENVTVDHNEVFNGNQGVNVNVKRLVRVSNNHIHSLGSMTSDEDTHGIAICGSGTMAASWSEAITLDNNSIHDAGGDGVQENTDAYCSGTFQYLVISNNNIYNNQEQGFDSKGTSDVRIFGNNMYNNGEGGIIATNDPQVVSKMRWEIYDNRLHDHKNYAIAWAQSPNCGAWLIHDNLIYSNVKNPDYNYSAVALCGDSASKVYNNVFYNNTKTSGSTKTSAVKDNGNGAGIINNIFYNNGIGSGDYGAITNISGEDSGNPSNNYIYPACGGGACKAGTNAISTCMTSGNCPGFANLGALDFHLLAGSPAINAGVTLPAQFVLDFEGRSRGANGAWDLGAYEFGGSVVTQLAAPTNLRIVR